MLGMHRAVAMSTNREIAASEARAVGETQGRHVRRLGHAGKFSRRPRLGPQPPHPRVDHHGQPSECFETLARTEREDRVQYAGLTFINFPAEHSARMEYLQRFSEEVIRKTALTFSRCLPPRPSTRLSTRWGLPAPDPIGDPLRSPRFFCHARQGQHNFANITIQVRATTPEQDLMPTTTQLAKSLRQFPYLDEANIAQISVKSDTEIFTPDTNSMKSHSKYIPVAEAPLWCAVTSQQQDLSEHPCGAL